MKKEEWISEVISWVKTFVFAAAVALFVNTTLVVNARVPTGSMENTIMTGSRVFVNRLAYRKDDPKRGDIIEFYYPDDGKSRYLKRVIAVSGEMVEGRGGSVFVDGVELEEPYIREKSYMDFGPYTVPEDSCFMMGDNRNNSWDSRYWNNKFVKKDAVIGKAVLEYYPEFKVFE